MKQAPRIEKQASPFLFTKFGKFRAVTFRDKTTKEEYLALVKGRLKGKKGVLVRVHSACLTGDVFFSLNCDCRAQLELALKRIASARQGVLLYVPHHEGRGIGLGNKMRAYELESKGKDTVEANQLLGLPVDKRDFTVAAQILRKLGLTTIQLLTNNPKKLVGLRVAGLQITKQVPIKTQPNQHNHKYLQTKKERLGHLL